MKTKILTDQNETYYEDLGEASKYIYELRIVATSSCKSEPEGVFSPAAYDTYVLGIQINQSIETISLHEKIEDLPSWIEKECEYYIKEMYNDWSIGEIYESFCSELKHEDKFLNEEYRLEVMKVPENIWKLLTK